MGSVGGEFKHFWDVLTKWQRQAGNRCTAPLVWPLQNKLIRPCPMFEAVGKAFYFPYLHAHSTGQQLLSHPLAEKLSRCVESRLSTLSSFLGKGGEEAVFMEQIASWI